MMMSGIGNTYRPGCWMLEAANQIVTGYLFVHLWIQLNLQSTCDVFCGVSFMNRFFFEPVKA